MTKPLFDTKSLAGYTLIESREHLAWIAKQLVGDISGYRYEEPFERTVFPTVLIRWDFSPGTDCIILFPLLYYPTISMGVEYAIQELQKDGEQIYKDIEQHRRRLSEYEKIDRELSKLRR